MLKWTVIFLIVAIIAGVLGFGGIAAGAAGIANCKSQIANLLKIEQYVSN